MEIQILRKYKFYFLAFEIITWDGSEEKVGSCLQLFKEGVNWVSFLREGINGLRDLISVLRREDCHSNEELRGTHHILKLLSFGLQIERVSWIVAGNTCG